MLFDINLKSNNRTKTVEFTKEIANKNRDVIRLTLSANINKENQVILHVITMQKQCVVDYVISFQLIT